MKRLLASALVVVAGAAAGMMGAAAPACACSCVPTTEAQAYERADTVFAGTLVRRQDPPDGSSSVNLATLMFAVDKVYKGDVGATQKVLTAMSSASCGLEVQIGKRYLVHADPSAAQPAELEGSLCGGTRPFEGTEAVAGNAGKPPAANPPAVTRADEPGADAVQPLAEKEASPWQWSAVGLVLLLVVSAVAVFGFRRRQRA